MTEVNLDAIESELARYDRAIGPGGEKAWSAGLLAQCVRPLVDEVRQLRAALAAAAPAVEPTDRQLLIAARRWALANGWHLTWSGWANAPIERDATTVVHWDEDELFVRRRTAAEAGASWPLGLGGLGRRDRYPVRAVREAVDVLVAVGVLPAELSSAYRAALAATATPGPAAGR
ncbi:hypothetical protein [Micromonospora haikouensis]|uniref:hypothetical protein n=1 Tax=Micromonospora haikouensis TaxID=686309 RepID=UPI003D74E0D3